MEYSVQSLPAATIRPRLIIHGGAGNILRENYPAERYQEYRKVLLEIVRPRPTREFRRAYC